MRDPLSLAESPLPERARVEAFRSAVLAWFARAGRDLPWRRTRDPWRILVSEVMLQQIQVSRAIPFYKSFTLRFPTVGALAAAPLSEAIRAWGDLGRYRRVVNLHRTARIIVDEHGGAIPSDPQTLATLPGIGPYTAGAVACFAYERDVSFADTNVRRVLHRFFLGPDVPEPVSSPAEILSLAEHVLPPGGAWGWNQALIELGALVCASRRPRCETCPVAASCSARPAIGALLALLPDGDGTGRAYAGSNRYYRGRVLAALRSAPAEGLPMQRIRASLGRLERRAPHAVEDAVRSLAEDGLVRVDSAPPAEAVAEGRAAYGGCGPAEPSDFRVSLPHAPPTGTQPRHRNER